MGSPSYFRIGADVELWRVVGHLCVLLLFLVVLEQLLHFAEHALLRFPKYFEMLRKVYRELMILGLISLGLKAVKALALADAESKDMLAFQAADIVIFLSAIALILQAICIFIILKRRNKRQDKYELVCTRDLAELVSHHDAVVRTKTWLQRSWPFTRSAATTVPFTVGSTEAATFSSALYHDMTRLRVLRHFFLRTQGLPEFFPFAKYLRHAQDHQISHMIEVEVTVWVLLMAVTWLLDSCNEALEPQFSSDIIGFSLVMLVTAFAWGVTLLHVALTYYLNGLLRDVLACCGYTSARDRLKCLRRIADDEERQLAHDMLDNAVEKMQRVQDEKELEQVEKDAKYTGLARHDTGLQVIVLLFRRLRGKTPASTTPRKQEHPAEATQDLERGHARMSSTDKPAAVPVLPKRFFFSRKVIHFMVKLLLVLNGFFFALMCQAVLYDLPPIAAEFGGVVALLIPLPLVLNISVLQPRIFRDYVLVACLFKVDVATLSEVITQFSESVELRTEFVDHLTSRMREQGQTLTDLRRHFHASDPTNSGCIELEELRQILRHFGCQVSYFRFNDVAKLLFRLKGTCVEYAQVERLLELAAMEDHARESMAPGAVPPNGAPHYMRTVMTEEAELHRRERCSTMEPTMQQHWRVLNDTLTPQRMHLAGSSSFPIVLTPLTPPLHSPAPVLGPARSPETAYRSVQESRHLAHL